MTTRRGSGHPGAPVDRNPGAAGRLPPDQRPVTRRDRLTTLVWNVAWEAARRVPEPVAFAVADLGGRVAWRVGGAARARVRANLAHVVAPADLDATVRTAFRSYARYWVESFRAADLAADDVAARTSERGMEHLDAVLDEGRGAIVLLAHHGSWDVAARWGESVGYHLAVVAEVVRPRALFEKFVRLRETVGLEVVPLARRAGAASLTRRLAEVLAANHLVGLLSDRDLTGKGPVVEFFGQPCRLPAGPVVLSRRTGAPIVPVTMLQQPRRRWAVVALEPVRVEGCTVEEGCARVAAALEALIRHDPAQWHAFQPIFLAEAHHERRPGTEGRHERRPGTEAHHERRPGTEAHHERRPGTEAHHERRPGTEARHERRPGTEARHERRPGASPIPEG